MNRVKKGLDNQAIGLLPLLLFMFLDNYFSYLLSFIIGVTFCFVCIFLFQVLSKDKVYQFMLLPSAHWSYIPYFFVSSLNLCCLYTLLLSRKYYWSWR